MTSRKVQDAQPEDRQQKADADSALDLRYEYLRERSQFESLLPAFKRIDAGIGNTDFFDLVTENASVNIANGECTRMKPNIRKSMSQLRSRIFNVYDPPVVFYDSATPLPNEVDRFLRRYQFRATTLSTNGFGERLTVPTLERVDKVLIAGDSVALGLSVNDDETLSSRLQQADADRQYVNLGVSGVGPEQIACALDDAAKRYAHEIAEVIYVFCDNDYDEANPRADPRAVVRWLKAFAAANSVRRVTMIRAPYLELLFPIAPDSESTPFRIVAARRLARLSIDAGFRYLDIADLAFQEFEATGSLFAPFRMFVDHVHLSPFGTQKLASAIVH
jgi:hypothetical protein